MDQTTVTRNLEILNKKGYIETKKGADDGRKKLVSLTPKGKEKLAETIPLWAQAQSKIVNGLGPDQFTNFLITLARIADLTK